MPNDPLLDVRIDAGIVPLTDVIRSGTATRAKREAALHRLTALAAQSIQVLRTAELEDEEQLVVTRTGALRLLGGLLDR